MKKNLFLISLILSIIKPVQAHCPLCTGAMIVAVGGAKFLGLNTAVIGVFTGGFALSTGLWLSKRFNKKLKPLIVLFSIILTLLPLAQIDKGQIFVPMLIFGEEGTLFNTMYSFNSLMFGGLLGVVTSWIAFRAHDLVKQKRGKVLFPYQSIAFSISALTIAGLTLQIILGA